MKSPSPFPLTVVVPTAASSAIEPPSASSASITSPGALASPATEAQIDAPRERSRFFDKGVAKWEFQLRKEPQIVLPPGMAELAFRRTALYNVIMYGLPGCKPQGYVPPVGDPTLTAEDLVKPLICGEPQMAILSTVKEIAGPEPVLPEPVVEPVPEFSPRSKNAVPSSMWDDGRSTYIWPCVDTYGNYPIFAFDPEYKQQIVHNVDISMAEAKLDDGKKNMHNADGEQLDPTQEAFLSILLKGTARRMAARWEADRA